MWCMRKIARDSILLMSAMLAVSPVAQADEQSSSVPLTRPKDMIRPPKNMDKPAEVKVAPELEAKLPSQLLRESAKEVQVQKSVYDGKKIGSVRIVGDSPISADAILKGAVVKPGQTYSEDNIMKDCRMIYMTGYYMNVQPEFAVDKDTVHVQYRLVPNPGFKGLSVSGTTKLDVEQLPALLGLKQGEIVNMKTVGTNLRIVDEQYKRMGYPLFAVTGMQMTPDGILHLTFREGIVEDIKIKGNKHTKDYVIGREIRQVVGEPLNQQMVQYSVQRLNALGLFSDVEVEVVAGVDPNKVQLVFNVDEANTATLGVGTTYSESDGFVGQLSIGDRNLGGRGEDLQFKWEFGGKTLRNYYVSYTKPYIDKKGTRMNVTLYDGIHESTEYDHEGQEMARFDKRAIGQEITLSRPEGDYVYNSIRIKNRNDKYVEPVGGYRRQYFEPSYDAEFYKKFGYHTTAEERRKEDFGITRSITFSRTYDNRDNPANPTSGKRNDFSFEWAGFGGDFNFQKLSFDQRYYWRMGAKGRHVLALDMAAGYAWGNMPLSQRFYVGGGSTLRGYEDGQFRGNSMLRASLEYRIPVSNRFSFVTFVDTGYAWDKRLESAFDLKKMKVGYGLGIRVQTPLGPVKLDYGIGSSSENHHKGRFHFSFGGSF